MIYLAPPAFGLGDLIVTIPIVQELIARGETVHLVLRMEGHEEVAERIEGLAGWVYEWEFDQSLVGECRRDAGAPNTRFVDLRDHPLQSNFWWGSKQFQETFPGMTIRQILRTICHSKGIESKCDPIGPLMFKPAVELNDTVLFIPGSAVSSKCWPEEYWLQLATQLRLMAVPSRIIGEPDKSLAVRNLLQSGMEWLPTPSLCDAIDAISSARAIVSVDTGLMHLAIHQSVPTVSLYRQAPVYLRHYPHVFPLVAETPCADLCHAAQDQAAHNHVASAGCDFRPADWNCQSAVGQRCMESILLEAAMAALTSALDIRTRRDPHHRQTEPHRLPVYS